MTNPHINRDSYLLAQNVAWTHDFTNMHLRSTYIVRTTDEHFGTRPSNGQIFYLEKTMRFVTTLTAAAALAMTSTTAFAGGVSPAIMEAPDVEVMPAPATSSVKPAYIVLGVLAALLIASQMDDDEPRQIVD